ncbi:hypothetical protein F5Y17DRAFT_458258 [Xylariaceae sp. FL0594]|nr:hypothetical protein F5Y17DRAFT_458258 [Xylariaceae sp. FL0594]
MANSNSTPKTSSSILSLLPALLATILISIVLSGFFVLSSATSTTLVTLSRNPGSRNDKMLVQPREGLLPDTNTDTGTGTGGTTMTESNKGHCGHYCLIGVVAGLLGAICLAIIFLCVWSNTCPWDTRAAQKLRYPACPSADILRKSIFPSFKHDGTSWTGPESCVNGTCIFSHAYQNGGIALITSRPHARLIQEYAAVDDYTAYPPPFQVVEIEAKGIGLRANRSISKGEVIMVRSPIFAIQTNPFIELEVGTRDTLYERALARLSQERRQAFDAQMGSDTHSKLNTNSFQMFVHGAGEKGTSHFACYADIGKINHDCRPNVHYRIENMTMTTLAARDIYAGEELSVSYVDVFLSSRERKERIRKWGFECQCSLCRASRNESAASDRRLCRIAQIRTDLNNFKEVKVTADSGVEYVALHEQEGLHAHLGSAYTRAALNFALFGDEKRAQEYAVRAVEELLIEKGPNSGDVLAMRALAENPRAHWTWGKRRTAEKKDKTDDGVGK